MDYCSTCRRHLNGALVCPGCGAYAPDIAPDVTAPLTTDTAADSAKALTTDLAAGGAAGFAPGVAPVDLPADVPSDLTADAADATPPRQRPGRAARRRQLARWKKTQRRALVATAVALVGGGLTVASMDRHSTDRSQAAPAPEAPLTGTVGDSRPAQHGDPPATPSDARQSPPAAGAPHQRSAPRGTTRQDVHPDVAAPRTAQAPSAPTSAHTAPTVLSAPRPDNTAPAAGNSASADPSAPSAQSVPSGQSGQSASQSPSAATQRTAPGSSTSDGTAQQTPQTSLTDTPTSPSHLCLLVICLG
ncbi:hypothetical protein [Streptomyces sp. NPDC001292]|uniref:SCO2400 family protein n=1 Tax=Streptomyces sp. NPDC001292 TaxID=3364558 RepID=UPI003696A78A